ncbi:MAG: hypothetical protein AB8H86_14650 [Polyangiales bacterium]
MSKVRRTQACLWGALLGIAASFAGTARAQVTRLPDPPPIALAEVGLLEVPPEPRRHYAWPVAVMSAATVMTGTGAFAIIQSAFSSRSEPALAVPFFFGAALFAVGLSWLIARAARFRRAHRAFEEGTPRLVW